MPKFTVLRITLEAGEPLEVEIAEGAALTASPDATSVIIITPVEG